jgi:sodium/potassium-transporting ATPase subunit alpha
MKARLRCAEKGLLNVHRHCKGDASETGLVQFAQSVMDLDVTRAKYKTHSYMADGKEIECLIPFSSDIKFNAFIRDMSADGDNLRVYMKGAPERILTRCSKILVDGQE